MFPKNIKQLIKDNRCVLDLKVESRNDYAIDKWNIDNITEDLKPENDIWYDPFDYELFYVDGEKVELCVENSTHKYEKKTRPLSLIILDKKLNYNYPNKTYNISKQIPLIKLFVGVLLSNKYVRFKVLRDDRLRFHFNLYNPSTLNYDEPIHIDVDKRLILDKNGNPVILNSSCLLDHLLLKAFIKLSTLMNIDIKNININSLVGICRGGKLYSLKIDKMIKDDFIDVESNQNTDVESNQNTDVFKSTANWSNISYNNYGAFIYNLFKQNMLIGLTIMDSFFYCVSSINIDENNGFKIYFYNIFTGSTVPLNFETIMIGLTKISVLT